MDDAKLALRAYQEEPGEVTLLALGRARARAGDPGLFDLLGQVRTLLRRERRLRWLGARHGLDRPGYDRLDDLSAWLVTLNSGQVELIARTARWVPDLDVLVRAWAWTRKYHRRVALPVMVTILESAWDTVVEVRKERAQDRKQRKRARTRTDRARQQGQGHAWRQQGRLGPPVADPGETCSCGHRWTEHGDLPDERFQCSAPGCPCRGRRAGPMIVPGSGPARIRLPRTEARPARVRSMRARAVRPRQGRVLRGIRRVRVPSLQPGSLAQD